MKNICIITIIAVLAVPFVGCEIPRQKESIPEYQFTGLSRHAIEHRAEVLAQDRQKSLKRFLDYRGTNLYKALRLYYAATDIMIELRNCYKELDTIRSGEDSIYNKYKAIPSFEDKIKGVNYYALMKQTEKTLKELREIAPKYVLDKDTRKYFLNVPGR